MDKKLCFALALTLACYWVESAPNGIEDLDFDRSDSDLSNVSYRIEDEDLDDFSRLIDDAYPNTKANNNAKTKVNNFGFKKKNIDSKGIKSKHNIQDLKRFLKSGELHDEELYDNDDEYTLSKGAGAKAIRVTGNEDRKYRKGTKTRGFHRIQHKDEYKKDKEIYEDDETSGIIKKIGAKGLGIRVNTGKSSVKVIFIMIVIKDCMGNKDTLIKRFATLVVAETINCCRKTKKYDNQEQIQTFKEMMILSESLGPDTLKMERNPIASFRRRFTALIPPPINISDETLKSIDNQMAFACSQLQCTPKEILSPVCACNYNTGNVLSFKNECESKKHNCRYNTVFRVILNEICPWDFQSGRDSTAPFFNYDCPKYYN
ncbi:unnamed protein product [Parnassius mnemosyne]|uniref:Kazal-like domain-containing protein n=1 Tax=Parnassius mnemosyne TaxID=213953 RepID=A0AAV1LGW1_9NEOP